MGDPLARKAPQKYHSCAGFGYDECRLRGLHYDYQLHWIAVLKNLASGSRNI
jgi:hypothetical protein